MNKVIASGRLTADAEVRYSQGSEAMAIARGTLAVDRRFKREGEQSADFIPLVAFKNQAEFLEKYGRKGTKFLVEGRWQTGNYTNNNGQKVYTNDLVIENIEFAESKAQNSGSAAPAPTPSSTTTDADEFMRIPDDVADDALPFN